MKSHPFLRNLSIILFFLLIIPTPLLVNAEYNQKIYDYAELLTIEELEQLEALSNQYSEEREVDITIVTIHDSQGLDIIEYTQDFYDDMGLGYDKSHGNAVVLAIDMDNRDVMIAGFYKGEEYIDNSRADSIRQKITPDLSEGYYYDAFQSYIELSHEYLDITPGVNPDNIFLHLGFQLILSLFIAGVIVMMMLYRSSGKITTSGGTYLDELNSAITSKEDSYIRKVVTKVKKPSNDENHSGGTTKGGHSHSGSSGKF